MNLADDADTTKVLTLRLIELRLKSLELGLMRVIETVETLIPMMNRVTDIALSIRSTQRKDE